MKKKRLFRGVVILSLCLVFFCGGFLVSNADVIWTPSDNFFEENYHECVHVGREYFANGSKGYVTIYESPRSSKIVDQFENGNKFFVSFTYTLRKNSVWGVVQYERDGDRSVVSYSGGKTGWIPMKDLAVMYDHNSFVEDHADEFEKYTGGFDAHEYEGEILFWTYPGSGVVKSLVDMKDWEDEQIDFSMVYTDKAGRKWGFVNYFFANTGWVCMSDPTNRDLPAAEVDYDDLIPPAKPEKPEKSERPEDSELSGDMTLVIGLVAGVAILTAAVIVVLFRKKMG